MKRAWLSAAIGILVVIGGLFGYRWYAKEEPVALAEEVTVPVMRGTLEVEISGTGSIEAAERETLKSTVTGTVEQVMFQEGDEVNKGDVLITFESQDNSDNVETKRLAIEKQKLELESLQEQLKSADADSRDGIMLNIRQKQLDIELSQAELAELLEGDEKDPIVAPIDGQLVTFDVKAGDEVSPNTQIGEIVNYHALKMIVGVDELDITKVEAGQQAELLVDAIPDKTYPATVSEIAKEGTSTNGVATFDVTVLLSEIDGLKPGMSAEATVKVESKENALYLPIDAVQSMRGQYFVLVAGSGDGSEIPARDGAEAIPQARPGAQSGQGIQRGMSDDGSPTEEAPGSVTDMPSGMNAQNRVLVEVGIHNEDYIEIVSGLEEGQLVVLPTARAEGSQGTTFPSGGGFQGGGIGFPGGGGFSGGMTGGMPGGGGR